MYKGPMNKLDKIIAWYRTLKGWKRVGGAWLLVPVTLGMFIATLVLFLVCIPSFMADRIMEG